MRACKGFYQDPIFRVKKMADEENYRCYVIPKDVGGRYSVFTPVGLLPVCVAGVNINELIKGAKKAFEDLKIPS